ncbi:hypothetical protein ACHAXR_009169 [Thalassiosira sp. AJA248-18]
MFKQHSIRHRAKVDAMLTTALDQAVDQAGETYHAFRAKLKSLISTLKKHHEAMLKLNSSQMKATKAICDLLESTPLSECALGTDHCSQAEEDERIKQEEGDKENDAKTDCAKSNQPDGTQTPGKSTTESTGTKHDKPFKSSGITHAFDSVRSATDYNATEFKALTSASYDLNQVYARRHKKWIIGYLEEWDKIIATRIEGRLIEFHQMRRKYVHYTDKVHGLHGKVDKQKTKNAAGAKPRLENKLDRNRLKLSGAEEAHHDFGKSLLSLIEEVTHHYWKDFLPLLHMIIQFNINHSSDLATVMAKLEKTDASLRNISKEHGVSIAGRLEELKPEENLKVDEEKRDEMEEKGEEDSSGKGSQGLQSV